MLGHLPIAGGPIASLKVASGSNAYTLTGNAGTYTLTGGSATLTKTGGAIAYSLTANAGSYSVTGGTAALKRSHFLIANAGTYSLTGGTAVLKKSRFLTANAGTYSLTGGTASLVKGRFLAANAGTYAVSGGTASLKLGHNLTANAGTYSITGDSAVLTKTTVGSIAYALTANAGVYSLVGGDAVLTKVSAEQTATGGPGRRPKRVYIERDGQILVFDKPAHAAAYISAEKALEVPAEIPQKSLPKRLQAKVAPIKQPEVIALDVSQLLAERFAVPEWQTAVTNHDYEALYRLHQHLLMLQDEEDIELLLLAA